MHRFYVYTMGNRGEWILTDSSTELKEVEAIVSAALHCGEQVMVLNDTANAESKWAAPPPLAG